jgi:hypothetical protein
VLVLRDEEATHERVVRAFDEWLIRRAGPDTEVVFWYSGHGSRVPDASSSPASETDGLDSTLVLYDSRAVDPQGAYDLSDDALYSLLAALEVVNEGEREVHFAVLSIAEDRSRNLIFARDGAQDNRLEPGQSREVRYLVIATIDHADFGPLASRMRSGSSPGLPDVLLQALDRPRMRGPQRSTDRSAFGIDVVDLLVERGPEHGPATRSTLVPERENP